MNVLYIGATGLVGSHVTPILKEKFDLTLTAFSEGEVKGMPVTAPQCFRKNATVRIS